MNKYFIPDVEDIRVGFVAEWLQEIDTPSEHWDLKTLQHFNLTEAARLMEFNKKSVVRVPFLTKEQIEKEGWREIHDEEYIKELPVEDGEPSKIWWFNNNANADYISKFEFRHRGRSEVRFWGECKSINEFRTLCKWLNIE
jgi:hypothetical protein